MEVFGSRNVPKPITSPSVTVAASALLWLAILGQGVARGAEPDWASMTLRLLASYDQPLAHEGPLHLGDRNELFFVSNRLKKADGSQYVIVSSFNLANNQTTNLGLTQAIPMANGAYRLANGKIVVTMQGSFTAPAGLAEYDPSNKTVRIVTRGFAAYQFNSPNDVVEARDGSIWFTDPQYGYEQGFRPKPTLGNWVWRFDPRQGMQRLMIDGFAKPNGIAFSRNQDYVYVTDSGYIAGNGERNSVLPAPSTAFVLSKHPKGPWQPTASPFAW